MITPSYGLTATERVLPKLALDFTTASLDSRVTFTRTGNTATVTNSSGYVVPINANLPRFDYNPVTLACKGLLIEESRINLLLRSEDFSTTWFNTDSSEQANATISPGNTLTADKLVEGNGSAFHAIQQDVATVSATSYTFSVFAKYSERNIQLWFGFADVSGNPVANFDLQNGVVGTTSGTITATIENYGNGWYRCSATVTSAVTIDFSCFIGLTTSTSAGRAQSYQGNGTSGAFLWGAQLEAGAFATSYIPTVATSVTRNADVATMTGTNFSDWYNVSEGAFVAKIDTFSTTGVGRGIIVNSLADFKIPLYIHSTGRAGIYDGTNVTLSVANILTYPNVSKVAMNYGSSAQSISLNAATPVSSVSIGFSLNGISIGGASNLSTPLNGHIYAIYYYPQKLTSAELQAFSK